MPPASGAAHRPCQKYALLICGATSAQLAPKLLDQPTTANELVSPASQPVGTETLLPPYNRPPLVAAVLVA